MSDDDSVAERLRAAIELLEAIVDDPHALGVLTREERTRLLTAAGNVFSPDAEARRQQTKARRRRERDERRQREEAVLAETGIRQLRARPVFTTPNVFPPEGFVAQEAADPELADVGASQHCYVCKATYDQVHHFYDQLCPSCATFNLAKRSELADLRGQVALVTGGRVKIGYQACIKLLRCGATVVVTTRFPRDAAVRYAQEEGFDEWGDRLVIYGLDLRHTPSVERLCRHLDATFGRLDHLVNNACQTVRRPPAFYEHMMDLETAALGSMPERARALLGGVDGIRRPELVGDLRSLAVGPDLVPSASLSQVPFLTGDEDPAPELFPAGQLDQDLQQVDLRGRNSWRLTLAEVSSVELVETQLVNVVAPFVLAARLKPLMLRTPGREKHIVNVSAVEGQFYRRMKTTRHPHTNMAKAALNMMTRTSATDYQADGIHMNSVDTGWVSDEDPAELQARKRAEHRFHPPLDIVDGAARIVDPIISGRNTGEQTWGQFLKDYRPTDW